MPRYGAKTYGKGQKKEDKKDGFDKVWTKSIGSKMSAPEFSPIKQSPVKKTKVPSVGQTSPTRMHITRSSPEKQIVSGGVRRTRSNSNADDPFNFNSEEENSKSPVRRSSRSNRNTSPPVTAQERNTSKPKLRSKQPAKADGSLGLTSSASKSNREKRQLSITNFTRKIPPNSLSNNLSSSSSIENSSKGDASSSHEVIVVEDSTDADIFSEQGGEIVSSQQEDNHSKRNTRTNKPIVISSLSSAKTESSLKVTGDASVSLKRLPQPLEDNLVVKRKSRDIRSNGEKESGDYKSSIIPSSNHIQKSFTNSVSAPQEKEENLVIDIKPVLKMNSNAKLKAGKEVKTEDDKDEFAFEDDSDNLPSSQSQSSQGSTEGTNPPALVKSRSKELPGIKRRIFNSPKKSPMKAKYNARSWAASGSEDIEEFSSEENSIPQSSSSSLSASQKATTQKPPKPVPAQPAKSGLMRVDKYPVKKNHSIVTSIKCPKQEKQYYTVVKHVKQALQCQDAGESQQFADDIEYLLECLKETLPVSTKCLSTISLMEKSTAPSFRMHLRAHSTITKIFTALSDAYSDPCLALCTGGLMYMLSKDRLNMDLDRNSLTLLVKLLSTDSEGSRLSWSAAQKEEYEKIRERLWDIVRNAAKGNPNQLFGVDQQTLSSGFFAMESLLSLTSKRAGEWFKEELRFAGGLDLIAQTVMTTMEQLTVLNKEPTHIELVDMRTLNRCVRVLENVTFMNSDNQQHLLEIQNCSLIKALASFLSLCETHIELCTPDDSKKQEQPLAKLVTQGLLANLRLLLNLTHDNEWGSMKVGDQAGLMFTVLQCVLQLPQFLPRDQRFDLLVLSLGLLINLVEHSVANTRILTGLKTCHSYDSQPEEDQSVDGGKEVTAIEALTELFLQRQRAAEKLENEEDDEEVPEELHNDIDDLVIVETEPIPGASDAAQQITQEEIKQSVRKALHTAGKHMEDSIVASYAALLLGCLLRENKLNVNRVRDCLPNGDFTCMVDMLKKLLNFMELTDADGNTGKRSISKVIEVLECC